ncbi:histidine kinase dimerization/phosphoacceptor domain-containing protein [Streptomyces sp. NPDC048558]|uniref:histidine kinase dimerization/phosphoacceptor domain-containing protein n=1 Tax=Streptomyces sp. NPDC048558 TaxID=3155759 RepID=UPI00344026A6
MQAVHDERRRIERDLHDGVQQRLVALGMLLGRALRATDPAKTDALLRQAHEESAHARRCSADPSPAPTRCTGSRPGSATCRP